MNMLTDTLSMVILPTAFAYCLLISDMLVDTFLIIVLPTALAYCLLLFIYRLL